ncbi:tRNA lysidine(34) synthetase TilS [Shewanella sp. C32]|uniref:tRNA(Ile)-lysidine synthase n=1 Tax=Shewanella electrica TaxID=515560 RepID=A0ABT2FNT3_9GAMM|nr:tRNA lysidine(34) synthetase TilS [Shewanella electrica]MCH1924706.1 tRNA lysidine(34) synthetase TilS [Shewanella electrica]MCS4556846.1 tRNA lysidine(34) synthetase TilS [Shewanella electrica]
MSRALTDAIIHRLQQLLAELTPAGAVPSRHLWLGFSGGMDSALLAYALNLLVRQQPELRPWVHLVHIHHGLNPHADDWAAHCLAIASEYQLDGRVLRVTLKRGARISVEAEARQQRYQVLAGLMQAGDVLLTAHHQDDQLETVLLALKRGQGPKGLAAMGALQSFAQHCWQLRPMLNISREQIEQAVDQLDLDYVDDDSNLDTRYDRNFLRQLIIPELKQRWPSVAETAARSAALCAEQQALLEEVAAQKLTPLLARCALTQQATLNIAALQQVSPAWQRQLLRQFCLQQQLPPPSQVQLQQLQQQLFSAQVDASVALNFGHVWFRRFDGALYIDAAAPTATPNNMVLDALQQQALLAGCWRLPQAAPWQQLITSLTTDGPRIALAKLRGKLEIRYGVVGSQRCHPHWRAQGRELKKVWQEAKVPPWLRPHIPLLYADGQLIAAASVFIEQHALAADTATGLTLQLD